MLEHNPYAACTVGERYEADVPDTLDLADRMELAVNALTNVWFPDERWGLGFTVDFARNPVPLNFNHITDTYLNIPPKFLEALAVCRLASGCADNLDVDREVLRVQLELLGEDGLTYAPNDTFVQHKEVRDFSEIWGEGRSLLALSMIAQVDDDPRWIEVGKRKIDRMLALSTERDGYRFFWRGRFRPGDSPPSGAAEPDGNPEGGFGSLADGDAVFSMIYSVGALGHGAGLFGRVSGYEPALDLAGGLARWALKRMFRNDDGRYDFWHFHHGLYALMAVCEYGIAANDGEVLERVDACYRWAREMGDPLVGFYAEYMPGADLYLNRQSNTVEICEVADMVFLALCLTRAGIGDYLDDVDRWVRNMYAEGQIVDAGFYDRLPDGLRNPEPRGGTYEDTDDVVNRSVGSFLGWMRGNDGLAVIPTPNGPKLADHSIMHCCTANGARTLYYVWDTIVAKEPSEVRVNLLLNRASPWLDVDSYLPAEGKVVLHVKDAPAVAVRMPEWCDAATVKVRVGDAETAPAIDGRYVGMRGLSPGDDVTLTFPVPERTVHRVLGEMPYKLTVRGSNVVDVDPKGVAFPLYESQPTGQTVQKTRFVHDKGDIVW